MNITFDIDHRQGEFSVAAKGALHGPVSVLSGPSGSGKTTLLNIFSGLVRPQAGRLTFDDTVWFDAAAKIFVPPHRRRIGYVFQEGRLLPHLSVRHNLTFSHWFRRPTGVAPALTDVTDLLGITPLLDRGPRNLSGGERQRVALARALLASPALLLMDEPLASLDEARRDEVLPYIESVRDHFKVPIVYVTHSSEEAERLGNEIVRLRNGRIEEIERRDTSTSLALDG
ncbi:MULTISPECIES: ATP-binding cassette domain-containing protein [unclassified Beijerinckia]|uniref:ATP-binding cassette domain-containing protein n=1 Tax=unclassified Beijerinckia TaxID=2638183 RepID=UPI0008993770|nr:MULTISPECIES: ATP-binding cassette domain-containing protein [unclassified Beijerinckia]MDH7797050.1 molybdenum ABC transporter ATP-binding protein [Beijerinckia sp. GAS462]SEC70177.1 molybdate transport system ATP-binding protein [Beijerinckia sp. 28-YEA-48]